MARDLIDMKDSDLWRILGSSSPIDGYQSEDPESSLNYLQNDVCFSEISLGLSTRLIFLWLVPVG